MEPLELSLTDVLLRAENGVLEAFYTRWDSSIRVPLAWLAVRPEPQRRGDFVFLFIGPGNPPGPVLYGVDVQVGARQSIPIPVAEEPAARAFFADVARQTGRLVQP